MTELQVKQEIGQSFRIIFWMLATLNLSAGLIIWFAFPAYRCQMTDENMFQENLNALFLGVAFLISACTFFTPWTGAGKKFHMVIPGLCLLGFLDEVSFGADYFFDGQKLVLGTYELDGVHDLFALSFKVWRDFGNIYIDVLTTILMGTAIALAILYRRRYTPLIMACVKRYPAFDFVRFAVILIGTAMIIDLNPYEGGILALFEEILETSGGLSLFFAAIIIHYQRQSYPSAAVMRERIKA